MSVLGNILKNAVVGTALGSYRLAQAGRNAIQEEIDRAKLEELEKRNELFSKEIAHYSKEEQDKIRLMAKRMAMQDLSKGFAKDQNNRARLKFKLESQPVLTNK